jgi:hypothetical protein
LHDFGLDELLCFVVEYFFELFRVEIFFPEEVEVHEGQQDGEVDMLYDFDLCLDDFDGVGAESHCEFLRVLQFVSGERFDPQIELLAVLVAELWDDLFEGLELEGEGEGEELLMVLGVDVGVAQDGEVVVVVEEF